MIRAVSAADVVVVNPTHYAVALKYDAAKGAPEVVAKGAGRDRGRDPGPGRAARGPDRPRAASSPGRSTRPARSASSSRPNLYEAVAHLLAFVFGLRAKGRAEGYHELPKPVLL